MQTETPAQRIRQTHEADVEKRQQLFQFKHRTEQLTSIERSLLQSFQQLVRFLDGKTTKTEVVNQLRSIATPDVAKVVQAIEKLDKDVAANKLDLSPIKEGLSALEKQLDKIPKTLPTIPDQPDSVKVSNLSEIGKQFEALEKAIKGLKLVAEAPKVDVQVPETTVNVEKPDLAPLQESMLKLLKAVQEIELPTPPVTDLSKLEKEAEEHTKQLKKLVEKPIGGGGGGGGSLPYETAAGAPTHITLSTTGGLPTITVPETTIVDSPDATTTYVGAALPGSVTSAAAWQICKIDTSSGTIVNYAGGGAYNQIWNNRSGLSYA